MMFFCCACIDQNPFDSTFVYAFSGHANFQYYGGNSCFIIEDISTGEGDHLFEAYFKVGPRV